MNPQFLFPEAKSVIGFVFRIPRGVWHHIVVSEDATVIVVENSNTAAENSEHVSLEEYRKGTKK